MNLDVTNDLKDIKIHGDRLNFIQLYCDSPHAHVDIRYKHPVSGALVNCGIAHPNFKSAVNSRAHGYMTHMRDLNNRMVGQVSCRIEIVVQFTTMLPEIINPEIFINIDKVKEMITHRALLIPFKEHANKGLIPAVNSVMGHLIQTLSEQFSQYEGIANFSGIWKSYQAELALEEMLYGRPLSPVDYDLSVALGTCTGSEKSLSYQRGFLGLSMHNRATSEESLPPLENWTRDSFQCMRLQRIFPLCQTLDATPLVTGSALIQVLLKDIYRRNDRLPLQELKSRTPPGRLVGALPFETFCDDLANKECFGPPHTFGRACLLVTQAGSDPKDCLVQGFLDEKINFFPAIKYAATGGQISLSDLDRICRL